MLTETAVQARQGLRHLGQVVCARLAVLQQEVLQAQQQEAGRHHGLATVAQRLLLQLQGQAAMQAVRGSQAVQQSQLGIDNDMSISH